MDQAVETPMWMVDATTYRIMMANSSAQKLFGYSADQLTSMTIFDVIIPDEADALRQSFSRRAFAGDGGTWTIRHPNGTRFRLRIRYHYVTKDGSKLQFTFADEIFGHPQFPDGKTQGVSGS